MSDSWYDVVDEDRLMQGDILLDCPVVMVAGQLEWPLAADMEVGVGIKVFDFVVLTQSCDLQNEKVEDVLLGQLISWPKAVEALLAQGNQFALSKKFRKQLVDGNIPSLSLLHKCSDEPSLPWSVVDFHRLNALPKSFLQQFVADRGLRLRLRSPYREHLAQAFARYFMRIGLPHDAREFETEGAIEV